MRGEALPTLTEIATKAGVQRTTIYRRWGSTESVLLEATNADPQKAMPIPDTGSLQTDLEAIARAGHKFHNSEEGRTLIEMLIGASEEIKQTYWKQRYAVLSQIFERAVERNEISPQEKWDVYLDVFIAPRYFCTWGKAEQWTLESSTQLISILCSALKDGSRRKRSQ